LLAVIIAYITYTLQIVLYYNCATRITHNVECNANEFPPHCLKFVLKESYIDPSLCETATLDRTSR